MPSHDETGPSVSVILVNWNGKTLLGPCLSALAAQSYASHETILVDNGSTDGSIAFVREAFPDVRVVALPENLGFCRANNVGLTQARGRYIALLNNDAEPDPEWLSELVAALEAHPEVGFCASKMLLWHQRGLADACGDFYSIEGVPGKIGHLEPADKYSEARYVFGACAGAAIYRRSVLEDTGGFDEAFFFTHEDSDLSFRAQLMGYRCFYVPTAVAFHHVGATVGQGSSQSVYYSQRNTEFVYLKNMPAALLLKYAPLHLLADALSLGAHLARGQGRSFFRAKLDALRMAPAMLKKRREIQGTMRTSAADIDRLLERGWLWSRLRRSLARVFPALRAHA